MRGSHSKTSFNHARYASCRPIYPPSLYATVLAYHAGPRAHCLDLGTGHGLVARALSPHFARVTATDPSEGMLAQAQAATDAATDALPNITFRAASAEALPFLADGSVDLVVAGQAAHWFDYPRLWPGLARVVRPGGSLAFWGYRDATLPGHVAASRLITKYAYGEDKMGPYWSRPGRGIVEDNYRAIVPAAEAGWRDVQRLEYWPDDMAMGDGKGTMFLQKSMTLHALAEYIRTWSAYHGWQEAHKSADVDVVDELVDEMMDAEGWASRDVELCVEWGSGLVMARRQ